MCHVLKCLEPQATIYKWLFQLDDSQSLHRKWLEITNLYIGNGCLEFQVHLIQNSGIPHVTIGWIYRHKQWETAYKTEGFFTSRFGPVSGTAIFGSPQLRSHMYCIVAKLNNLRSKSALSCREIKLADWIHLHTKQPKVSLDEANRKLHGNALHKSSVHQLSSVLSPLQHSTVLG